MVLSSKSPEAVRVVAFVASGWSLRRAARTVGVEKRVGRRFLRDAFLELRASGLSLAEAAVRVGLSERRVAVWNQLHESRGGSCPRHHLSHAVDVEEAFWRVHSAGAGVRASADAAGVGSSTAYRWVHHRFDELRGDGETVALVRRRLRLHQTRAADWERRRQHGLLLVAQAREQQVREATRQARALAEAQTSTPLSPARQRRQQRLEQYWSLMREGRSNAAACRELGISRKTGVQIRKQQRTAPTSPKQPPGGRHLSLRERLQIADLRQLGASARQIARTLGRSPSTVTRELARHQDDLDRYLPRVADAAAAQRRRRPRPRKLAADPELRRLVQRKLNRRWSPEEISGWLRRTYPDDPTRQLAPETIYRALLLPGGDLHPRYHGKLRTGRRVRRARLPSDGRRDGAVRNMTNIAERPADIEDKQVAGHWEGDLIVGRGSASAMITLRERKTQYGLIINLPADHTSATVTAALVTAFAAVPRHLKQTLTWDQGTEMARHAEFTAATGIPVYFADKCSPWQRGANENFNKLVRQYFPKGENLAQHSRETVSRVVQELNTRPRKGLQYKSPAAALADEARRAVRSTAA